MSNATAQSAAKLATSKPIKTVFPLSAPVTFNGETYSEVTYRPATGRDMRKFLNGGRTGDKYTALMVDLCELPEAFFDAMPAGEYMALSDVMDGFFKRGPATSTT